MAAITAECEALGKVPLEAVQLQDDGGASVGFRGAFVEQYAIGDALLRWTMLWSVASLCLVDSSIRGKRVPPELRVRGTPTRNCTWDRQGGGQNAPQRDLFQTLFLEPIPVPAGRGCTCTIQEVHPLGVRIMDEPKRVSADTTHVRIDDGQDRA